MKGFKEGKNNLLCFGLAALLGMGGLGFGLTKNGEVSRLESELAQANQEVVHLTDSNQTLENEKDALISELEQTRTTAQELAVNAMAKASKQDVPAFSGSASFVVSEEKLALNAESLFDELYVKAKEGKVETTAVVLGADNVRQDWQVEEDFEPLGWKSVTSDFIESDQFYQKTRLVPVELMDQAQDGLIVAGTPAFASELENYFSKIEDYIAETGNHVTYRVDPLYEPEAKLCNGVFLKARSMEDDTLSFDVFVYNEQPEFVIDRKTSDIRDLKKEAEEKKRQEEEARKKAEEEQKRAEEEAKRQQALAEQQLQSQTQAVDNQSTLVWIPRTGSKYHMHASCSNMKNPSQVSKEQAIAWGFEPCKKCY